jgi:hypothetical protein
MAYSNLVLAISIASFAVQQFNNLIPDFIITWVLRSLLAKAVASGIPPAPRIGFFTEAEAKRYLLGLLSWIWGTCIAGAVQGKMLILLTFYPTWNRPILDILFTGLVIGAGTDGVNSVLKFAQYAKQAKGSQAGSEVAHEAGLLPLGGADAAPPLPVCPPSADIDYGKFRFNRKNDPNPLLLHNAVLQPIFWGNYWQTGAAPTKGQIMDALNQIASPPYFSGLTQYCINIPTVLPGLEFTDPPPDPDGVNLFDDGDVQDAINMWAFRHQISIANTDQHLFIILVPPGLKDVHNDFARHSIMGGAPLHYAWISAFSSDSGNDGSLDAYTVNLSHELVEACTNPENTGWTGDVNTTCSGKPGWCEIADFQDCEASTGLSAGVLVQSYWSNRDKRCIIPR